MGPSALACQGQGRRRRRRRRRSRRRRDPPSSRMLCTIPSFPLWTPLPTPTKRNDQVQGKHVQWNRMDTARKPSYPCWWTGYWCALWRREPPPPRPLRRWHFLGCSREEEQRVHRPLIGGRRTVATTGGRRRRGDPLASPRVCVVYVK